MSRPEVLEPFESLRVWSRGGERAPHKPLLVLFALGRLARGESEPVSYAEVDEQLGALLRDFGPDRDSYHPEYPFWRLSNDGLWRVDVDRPDELVFRVGSSGPTKTELLNQNARGRFLPEVQEALLASPEHIVGVARHLLDAHFPETLHGDILDAVGLDLLALDEGGDDREVTSRRKRDPRFRGMVLAAYEDRCAVCGYDLSLGRRALGVEAAHIRWHQAKGPDEVTNGLALCSQHHKVFDLGAFTVVDEARVVVSDLVRGHERMEEVLLRHHGQPLRSPVHPDQRPVRGHFEWHRREVFRGRSRPLV